MNKWQELGIQENSDIKDIKHAYKKKKNTLSKKHNKKELESLKNSYLACIEQFHKNIDDYYTNLASEKLKNMELNKNREADFWTVKIIVGIFISIAASTVIFLEIYFGSSI